MFVGTALTNRFLLDILCVTADIRVISVLTVACRLAFVKVATVCWCVVFLSIQNLFAASTLKLTSFIGRPRSVVTAFWFRVDGTINETAGTVKVSGICPVPVVTAVS
jgi:hypothetical protein